MCLSIPPLALLGIGVNTKSNGVIHDGKISLPSYAASDWESFLSRLEAAEATYEAFPALYNVSTKDTSTGKEWVEQCSRVACPNGTWTPLDKELCRLFSDNNILHLFEFGSEDEEAEDEDARICMNLYVLYNEDLQNANFLPPTAFPMLLVRYDATDVGIVFLKMTDGEERYVVYEDLGWEEVEVCNPLRTPHKDPTYNLLDASSFVLPTLKHYCDGCPNVKYLPPLMNRMKLLNKRLNMCERSNAA